jgi:hypothetical protein
MHLAKPRVIGIVPTIWRVHMRARRRLVSEWEQPFDRKAGFFLNSQGRSLASSVWRQAMRSYIVVVCDRFVVEVQADLRKAFDHVCKAELWAHGRAERSVSVRGDLASGASHPTGTAKGRRLSAETLFLDTAEG